MILELADQGGGTDALMIDATYLKRHRTASSLGLNEGDAAHKVIITDVARKLITIASGLCKTRQKWSAPAT